MFVNLTKLRVQLRKAEHELEIVRVALENEKEERHRADTKLTSLQHALERRTREVEERDRDRSRADERCNELLALVKDSNVKVKETEQRSVSDEKCSVPDLMLKASCTPYIAALCFH
ncbi:hypothetical protein COOONC_00778 [Cooperia oncophora]